MTRFECDFARKLVSKAAHLLSKLVFSFCLLGDSLHLCIQVSQEALRKLEIELQLRQRAVIRIGARHATRCAEIGGEALESAVLERLTIHLDQPV